MYYQGDADSTSRLYRETAQKQTSNGACRPAADIELAPMRVLCLESATHSESGANRSAMSDKRT
jgi:hypothetical protein